MTHDPDSNAPDIAARGGRHTAGPWNVELPMEEICFSIVDDADQVFDWKMVASVMWDDPTEHEPGRPFITKPEAAANAKLIAAAPTMFEALMDIAVLAKPGSNVDKIARAALLKAREA